MVFICKNYLFENDPLAPEILSMLFHYFLNITLGKMRSPAFEEILIPFTQQCFVPSLVDIGPVVLEKKIFIFHQYIFAISYFLLFKKGTTHSFEYI